ncbi:MAG: hypothetical protein KDI46_02960 [Alphaproteobacteria bacterium]|nr:hypothetical protein [Alphaproteobacteria bacterium]
MIQRNMMVGWILLAVLAFLSVVGLMALLPYLAKRSVDKNLQSIGFQGLVLPTPQTNFSSLRYGQISLDPQGFSSIQSLDVRYNWISMLLFGQIERVKVSGLRLTGELDGQGHISIAGWSRADARVNPSFLSLGAIDFSDAQLSLLSSHYGGISVVFSGGTQKETASSAAFQFDVKYTQKNLRFESVFRGQINGAERWNADMEIGSARIDYPDLKATRASGQVAFLWEKNAPVKIDGEIRTGLLNVLGTPWQDAAITLQGNFEKPQAIVAAKAQGDDRLELGLALPDILDENLARLSGHFYVGSSSAFWTYLQTHGFLTKSEKNDLGDAGLLDGGNISFDRDRTLWDVRFENASGANKFHGLLKQKDGEAGQSVVEVFIRSDGSGHLAVNDPAFFEMIEGGSALRQTLRKRLADIAYTKLVVRSNVNPADISNARFIVELEHQGGAEKFTLSGDMAEIVRFLF